MALVAAPWLATVLGRHGLAPFWAAAQTGWRFAGAFWLPLITLDFAGEPFLTFTSVLAILGLILSLARREFFLPAWFILPFFVGPRVAAADATIPLAILAGNGLSEIVLPGIAWARSQKAGEEPPAHVWENGGWSDRAVLVAIGFFMIYSLFSGYNYSLVLARTTLSEEERTALEWVRQYTPSDSHFVLITGRDPITEPSQEWFPALTERTNVAVIQGYEWLPGGQFMRRYLAFTELQTCAVVGIACLEAWVGEQGDGAGFIWLSRGGLRLSEGKVPFRGRNTPLFVALSASPNYVLVYASEEVKIFAHR